MQAEVLDRTFQVRAEKVAIVFTDKAADLIESELLEQLSTTHHLHHLRGQLGISQSLQALAGAAQVLRIFSG